MAIHQPFPTANIVHGLSTVWPGDNPSGVAYFTHNPGGSFVQSYASGDQLWSNRVANGRFLADTWTEGREALPLTAADTTLAPSGNDAILYYPGVEHQRQGFYGVAWSYKDPPTSGAIVVESPSGTVVFQEPVETEGTDYYPFPGMLKTDAGNDVFISLRDGHVAKRLSILGRRVE